MEVAQPFRAALAVGRPEGLRYERPPARASGERLARLDRMIEQPSTIPMPFPGPPDPIDKPPPDIKPVPPPDIPVPAPDVQPPTFPERGGGMVI